MHNSMSAMSALCAAFALTVVLFHPRSAEGMRKYHPADTEASQSLWTKAADGALTSYGHPVAELLVKSTSVDHFSKGQYTRNDTFDMRYILVWPEVAPNATSPIFLFCGQESSLAEVSTSGYYSELANVSGILQIWPEHRYYAEAEPYYPDDNLEHFTIEQALVDHIELVLYIQNAYNLDQGPVLAIGSSYSGQISSWLRMRYPDVIAGAISSSPTSFGCPGLGMDPSYDPYGYAKVATRAASTEGGSAAACAGNVQKFFQTIFSLAKTADGRAQINDGMDLCSDSVAVSNDQVNSSLASYVQSQWVGAAQYNAPVANLGTFGVPAYRVRAACEYLSDASLSGTDLLGAMTKALALFTANASVANGCLEVPGAAAEAEPQPPGAALPPTSFITANAPAASPSAAPEPEAEPGAQAEADAGQKFAYQVCVQDQTPASYDGVTDMFFEQPYSLDGNDEMCMEQFGIHAQYNWAAYNFGLSAVRQSSRIFFTNGIYDPYIACGPTVNISETITAAVYEGCHAYDVGVPQPEDPPSVTAAREQGRILIGEWVKAYRQEKATLPVSNAANMFNLIYDLPVSGYTEVVNDTLAGSNVRRNQSVLEATAEYSNNMDFN